MLTRAHKLLAPIMLRRLKSQVEDRLPPKVETKIECPLSPMQVGRGGRYMYRHTAVAYRPSLCFGRHR